MTGKQLTEQLIADINKSVENRQKVEDPLTQIKKIENFEKLDLSMFMKGTNTIVFDGNLDKISQLINFNEKLVKHVKGQKVNINVFQREVANNFDKIAETFQQILDNSEFSKNTYSKLLKEILADLHNTAK